MGVVVSWWLVGLASPLRQEFRLTSHKIAVLSQLAEALVLPSGLKVLSSLAEALILPSRLNA
ncbi:MAG: hypothetical protein ACHBN1_16910 [Heteroscytonema crispum UTEX LB 1556]